jgi:hypothetical protein
MPQHFLFPPPQPLAMKRIAILLFTALLLDSKFRIPGLARADR